MDGPIGIVRKVALTIGSALLVRALALFVLPDMGLEGLTWPLYGLFWIYLYVIWTDAGRMRL